MTPPARSHLRSVPAEKPTEEDLVRDAALGDTYAFSELFRSHARYIAGVAYRILGNADEVDDVVQETFIAAHRSLGNLNEVRAFRRWLVTIAIRQVNKKLQNRRRRKEVDWDTLGASEPATDPRQVARVEELYEALSGISPELRIPWLLARLEGHSLADVAIECEISLATTKRRLALADDRLRRRLDHG